MGITPQALREHLMQAVVNVHGAPDKAPKRHREHKTQNWQTDSSRNYDPSEETKIDGAAYTRNRERFWRSIGKRVANGSYIR